MVRGEPLTLPEIGTDEIHRLWDEAVRRDGPGWPAGFRCPSDCCECCRRTLAPLVVGEEARIAADAARALPEEKRKRIRARLDAALANRKGACPLLEEGRCTIYSARPLVCRAYGFSSDDVSAYFGCEILFPQVQAREEIALPNFRAAWNALPRTEVRDRAGQGLPEILPLIEALDRLLP